LADTGKKDLPAIHSWLDRILPDNCREHGVVTAKKAIAGWSFRIDRAPDQGPVPARRREQEPCARLSPGSYPGRRSGRVWHPDQSGSVPEDMHGSVAWILRFFNPKTM